MTHFPTFAGVITECDANPGTGATVRTTVETGRLLASDYERIIYGIAHTTGVDLTITVRKGLFGASLYLTVNGDTPGLAQFFRRLQELIE